MSMLTLRTKNNDSHSDGSVDCGKSKKLILFSMQSNIETTNNSTILTFNTVYGYYYHLAPSAVQMR